MTNISLAGSAYKRQVAKEPYITLHNRFAERNPVLNEDPVSLIARPGMRKFAEVGDGHIRKIYGSVGSFNDDAFIVSGSDLYRLDSTLGGATLLGTISSDALSSVSMAITAAIGPVPAYLFIAEGGVLWVYTDNGHARSALQASGTFSNSETMVVGGVYYQLTNGSVDSGSPAGTAGNPWLVALGGTTAATIQNLYQAVGAIGTPGTTYSTALTAHTTVEPLSYTSTEFYIQAIEAGADGNAITTTETMSNAEWNDTTLEDGGTDQLSQVTLPDDVGAISITHINSYVIVVPVQSEDLDTIGRFYWIEPGEVTIDPLNFATAERSPDGIHQVITFGEMFWLFGQKTTEPWQTTGNPEAPMERFPGILYDRGSWAGTAAIVKDSMIVVDEDGGVFQLASDGRGMRRISRPDIEERIRRGIQNESLSPLT